MPERIDFKIAVFVYRCLHGLAPALVSRAAERQGHAVEAAITAMVFGQFRRPDVVAVYCRRLGLSSHCGTSLERSACGRYLVDHAVSLQATAQE